MIKKYRKYHSCNFCRHLQISFKYLLLGIGEFVGFKKFELFFTLKKSWINFGIYIIDSL